MPVLLPNCRIVVSNRMGRSLGRMPLPLGREPRPGPRRDSLTRREGGTNCRPLGVETTIPDTFENVEARHPLATIDAARKPPDTVGHPH